MDEEYTVPLNRGTVRREGECDHRDVLAMVHLSLQAADALEKQAPGGG